LHNAPHPVGQGHKNDGVSHLYCLKHL